MPTPRPHPAKTAPARILLVDADASERRNLKTLLRRRPDLRVVGECSNKAQALTSIRNLEPDLVIMDQDLADSRGKSLLERIGRRDPGVRCVVLGRAEALDAVLNAVREGAAAYVLKGGPLPTLLAAMRAARDGALYIDPRATRNLLSQLRGKKPGARPL